jgi:hypothetical protein
VFGLTGCLSAREEVTADTVWASAHPETCGSRVDQLVEIDIVVQLNRDVGHIFMVTHAEEADPGSIGKDAKNVEDVGVRLVLPIGRGDISFIVLGKYM